MMSNRSIKNKERFMEQLLTDFTNKIQGSNVNRLVGDNPEKVIYVGKLSPKNLSSNELSSETNINRIGMDFFISKESIENCTLIIKPSAEFYYRVFPTYEEQCQMAFSKAKELYEIDFQTISELNNYLQQNDSNFDMDICEVYEKRAINDLEIKIKLSEIYHHEKHIGFLNYSSELNPDNPLTNHINEFLHNVISSNDIFRVIREKVKIEHLQNENTWNNFLSTYSEDTKLPKWDIGLECEIRPIKGDILRVTVSLYNLAEKDAHQDQIRINSIFNTGLDVRIINGTLVPITMPYFEDDYKYDKTQVAVGNNCSVIEKEANHLITTHLPIFTQYRLKTNDKIKVTFKNLMKSPVKELNKIAEAMESEYEKWERFLADKRNDPAMTSDAISKLVIEVQNFRMEIDRFCNGIKVINNFGIVREAFSLMNQTFSNSAKNYDSWRLFQIVFIVSLIPDICTSEYSESELGPTKIDDVDLLYFPTGGGKTEAFLGTTIFTLFFDRLRNKEAGVSAIIKYPLRLLSVQQVQRVADILAMAEIIRKKHVDIKNSEPFSLGYFVGDKNTPNKITQDILDKLDTMTQEQVNEEYKIIDVCPFCRSTDVNVKMLKEELRLVHCCEENNCLSGGILPLYIVDREIFRYLPTVIISTIDKFASVGVQADFRNILGQVHAKCDKHGYTSRLTCTEREGDLKCKNDLESISLKDPAPTLFIQDELHLIRESLGVYDAHYETFIQYFIRNLSNSKKKVKIIGATATISSYQSQSHHLYLKDPVRFPCESPFLDRNFYSYIDKDELHRKIVGYAPFGHSVLVSVVNSLKYLKEILWEYYQNPKLICQIPGIELEDEKEALKLLEDYWIFLEYNNVKQDGNRVLGMLDTQTNIELQRKNIQRFDSRKMTGDDSFQDVRKVLAEVETTQNVFGGLNLIVATSMISHGVDADKFNIIFFFGMPSNTAEYIQAYSRVGRKYPGLVFMIMRPTRERDQSYLKNFIKFHEYKDILVESVPINRWAKKAIEQTFPGIFSALILNYYDFKIQNEYGKNIYMMDNLKEAIQKGLLDRNEIIQHIKNSYQTVNNSIGKLYDEWIEEAVHKIFDRIVLEDFSYENKRHAYITEGMERLGFFRPMTSLRDTEEQIIVELN